MRPVTFIHEAKRLVVQCLSLRLGRLYLSNESENLTDVKTSGLESFPVLNIPDVVKCVECVLL